MRGVAGPDGLDHLVTADGERLEYTSRLFASRRSTLLLFTGPHSSVVVKRVGDRDRIRDERAAIALLAHSRAAPGFVPILGLATATGAWFVHAGEVYFHMPRLGRDMVAYRAEAGDSPHWPDTALSVLATVAETLHVLWRGSGATYYDIKARNLLAVRDLVALAGPFSAHEVLLCDTASINSAVATHHPPRALTTATTPGSAARYRQYVAWGMAGTLLEMLTGPDLPRKLRRMRGDPTRAPIALMRRSLDHALVGLDPQAAARAGRLVALLTTAFEQGDVDRLLRAIAAS